MCHIGVFKKVNCSEWGAPTFIQPKKNGTVQFLSNFRKLNQRIRRKPFPIPKIQDMLLSLEGFTDASSLYLSMGYYHTELSPGSKHLYNTVLLWVIMSTKSYPCGSITTKIPSKKRYQKYLMVSTWYALTSMTYSS